jgi:hypothetical protein
MKRILSKHFTAGQLLASMIVVLCLSAHAWAVPTIIITKVSDTGEPGGSVGYFELTLTEVFGAATAVNISVGGTATPDSDYSSLGTSVTVPPGVLSHQIPVTVVGDTVVEATESVDVTLDNDGAGGTIYVVGASSSASMNIADNDTATVSIAATGPAADEDGGKGTFTVTLTKSSDTDTVVNISIDASSTAAPADYSLASSVTIPAHATTATVDLTANDDSIVEADETVVVALGSISSGHTSSISIDPASTAVTISDNDTATVSIAATDSAADEDGDKGTFTVTLTKASDTDTVVNISIDGSSTAAPADYSLASSVTIPANSTTATVDLTANDDSIVEADETVVVALGSISSGHTSSISVDPASAAVTISDNDTATVSITASDPNATENGDKGTFTVSLSKASDTSTVVNISIDGSSTTAPADYSLASSVTIPANATTATVDLTAADDLIVESDETVVAAVVDPIISGHTSSISVNTVSATVTITDDDTSAVSITATDSSSDENGDTGTFQISMSKASDTDTVVSFTPSGTAKSSDYDLSPLSPVTIPAGDLTADILVTPTPDVNVERDETVILSLGTVTGNSGISIDSGNASDTVTIANDDFPELNLSPASPGPITQEGQSGTKTVNYTVTSTLAIADDAQVTFDYLVAHNGGPSSTEDDDVTVGTFSASISNGDSVVIPVTIFGDAIVEQDELYTVTLDNQAVTDGGSATLGVATSIGTIQNDDNPQLSVNDVQVYEGQSGTTSAGMRVTTNLAIAADVIIALEWSVVHGTTNDADFATSPIENVAMNLTNLPVGGVSPIVLDIQADGVVESDEDFSVELHDVSVAGTTISYTLVSGDGVIINDEHNIIMSSDEDPNVGEVSGGGLTAPPNPQTFPTPRDSEPTISVNVANTCYHIDEVRVNGNPVGSFTNTDQTFNYTFPPVKADQTFDAQYARDKWKITSNIAGSVNGTIDPTGTYDGCTDPVYNIAAKPGYHISWVKVDGGLVASYTIADNITTYAHTFANLDADHTIEVAFTQRITVIENSDFGTIVPAPVTPDTSIEVEYGSQPSFVLTASDKCVNNHTHHISDIVVDGVSTGIRGQGEVGPYTYTYVLPVTQNRTLEAQFTGHVDVTVTGPGTVELGTVSVASTGSIEFESDIDQIFKIISATGYHVESVLLDGVEQGRVTELVINEEVAKDHTLDVKFAIDWYSIEPVSTYGSIFDDPLENILATTKYPSFGQNQSFYVDINDATHFVEALFIDNVKFEIPATGDTYVDPGGVFKLINSSGDTLEVQFTSVKASHRLVVLDYDRTPIADIPLVATSEAAPANIMYVVDDSGSMDWEVMVPGTNQGQYCAQGTPSSCSVLRTSIFHSMLDQQYRLQWKSQWYGYNQMFYNPAVDYLPWPRVKQVSEKLHGLAAVGGGTYSKLDKEDADTLNARTHPLKGTNLVNLSSEFIKVSTGANVVIDDEDGDANPATAFTWSNASHWTEVTGDSTQYLGDYRVSNGTSTTATATWSYTPDINSVFDISISWRLNALRSNSVKYEISCPTCTAPISGTSTTVTKTVNQQNSGAISGGQPIYSLGSYSLQAGKTVTVTMKNTTTSASKVSLDAVRFSPYYSVPNAHYYTWSETDGSPYLVAFDATVSAIRYFKVAGTSIDKLLNNSDDTVTSVTEKVNADIPADVKVTDDYGTALQNFANWFTYYRDRRFSALAAVSRSLMLMQGVQIGFSPLWTSSVADVVPLEKVKVDGVDRTDYLLEKLYQWKASNGTPLIDALEEVGEYFANTDTDDWSKDLASPYWSAEKGGACQQSFAILMTDGYWNSVGASLNTYHKKADNDNTTFTDGDGDSLYSDSYDMSTLADVAMYYYENDLSSSLANSVKTSPEQTCTHDDPANWQHMVTYTVSFGLEGTLGDPTNYNLFVDSASPNYPEWPKPVANQPTTTDDLWHAAVNGRGEFLSASNPDELVKSLAAITENISKRAGSSASVSINGDEQYESINGNIRMYQTSYNTAGWFGDVKAYRLMGESDSPALDTNDDGIVDASVWSASQKLESFLGADGSNAVTRKIFTYNTETLQSVTFNEANLSDSQLLGLYPYYLSSGATTTDVISYLRGDNAKVLGQAGGVFRKRNGPLGDFVNSKAKYENGVLYVGGNDGMLHAFDATDAHGGEELFAYIPSFVYPHLRRLADPAYKHNFFVDNTPFTKKIDNTLTLLVGGLGKGGKGYFGLDISNPGSFSQSNVMWEYPAPPAELISDDTTISFSNPSGNDFIKSSVLNKFTGDKFAPGKYITVIGADCNGYSNNGTYEILSRNADENSLEIVDGSLTDLCGNTKPITITESTSDTGIGYSFSNAVIVKSNDSSINAGTKLEGYVVIFGNGYASEDGTAQLYILNPLNGSVIKKIDTGFGPANGLSTPKAIDVDYDLKVDYVYAGDLLGNMWKFDMQGSTISDWQVAFCENGNATSHCNATGADLKPLFTTAKFQPITAAPDVMTHPTYKGYMVVFGTGQFLGMPDLLSKHTQSLYGIWDWAPDEYDKGYLGLRMDSLEDIDLDGRLDEDEDLNSNGILDPGEDVDGDGNLDVDEDLNFNGKIDALSPTLLSNGPVVDGLGNSTNTLIRQVALIEGTLTEDTNKDDILSAEEDVNENGIIDTYSYYRIPTNYKVDWTLAATADLNNDGKVDAMDNVPQVNLGWCFDLPGRIMDNDNVDNDGDGTIDEPGERSLGERVTNDAIIRDGRAILISFGVTGSTCDVGLFSFVNERNAETGGGFTSPIIDINEDGQVDEHDLVRIVDENGDVVDGVATDKAFDGRLFNPTILTTEDDGDGEPEEKKFMSSSSGKVEVITEKAEKRGVYYWQQVE